MSIVAVGVHGPPAAVDFLDVEEAGDFGFFVEPPAVLVQPDGGRGEVSQRGDGARGVILILRKTGFAIDSGVVDGLFGGDAQGVFGAVAGLGLGLGLGGEGEQQQGGWQQT